MTKFDVEEFAKASMDFGAYSTAMAEHRRARSTRRLDHQPRCRPEVDGERLTSAEIASFFILLAVAGNETTRNAISHGMLALTRYPEEREKWWADFDGHGPHRGRGDRAVGITGDLHAPHAQTRTTELSGTKMAKGDKVTLWYCSANRDESKFADPWTLRRRAQHPTRIRASVAAAPHFCLGANLARREISVTFEELRRRMPDIVATRRADAPASSFIHGIKQLPVAWTPTG